MLWGWGGGAFVTNVIFSSLLNHFPQYDEILWDWAGFVTQTWQPCLGWDVSLNHVNVVISSQVLAYLHIIPNLYNFLSFVEQKMEMFKRMFTLLLSIE